MLNSYCTKVVKEKCSNDTSKLDQYLIDEGLISDTEKAAELTPERLAKVVENTEKHLTDIMP